MVSSMCHAAHAAAAAASVLIIAAADLQQVPQDPYAFHGLSREAKGKAKPK